MNNIFSTSLSLDLGARYTGAFITNSCNEQDPLGGNTLKTKAFSIVMPNSDKFTYSTVGRTAVRHRLRGNQRFKLARRLLRVIVLEKVNDYLKQNSLDKSSFDEKATFNALFGLLKRRGYSRIEAEINLDILDTVEPSVFANFEKLGNNFDKIESIYAQWEKLSQDLQKVRCLNELISKISDKDFDNYFKNEYKNSILDAKQHKEAFKVLKKACNEIANQESLGHKHRSKYLDCIKAEISSDSRLNLVKEVFGGEDALWSLVGNISNLHLRDFRLYFNDPKMKGGDYWKESELKESLVRAFKYLHPTREEKANIDDLVQIFESSQDIIKTLCSIDPNRTIPPYEDQDNRHPSVDQTLLLSPVSLNNLYGHQWIKWAEKFLAAEPFLESNLDDILLKGVDRKSRVKAQGANPLAVEFYRGSYILQRLLDRSKDCDVYELRRVCSLNNPEDDDLKELKRVLADPNDLKLFLSFANAYYLEIKRAKDGLWLQSSDSLLERADIHPPKMNKVINIVVGNILSSDSDVGDKFINKIWDKMKVKGNSSVRSICKSLEDLRKKNQGIFNTNYNKAKYRLKQQEENKKLKIEPELKDYVNAVNNVMLVSNFIAKELGLNTIALERIQNAFSLAQLYTIIETERAGFTSTSIAVHKENYWRMTANKGNAICCRLPSDSIRPFDGVLRKSLDRQAWELAKQIVANVKENAKFNGGIINIAIAIEQNKFAFSANLDAIKKGRNLDKVDTENPNESNWTDKNERIKKASLGICPYTGATLGDSDGEIDHIIPRASTKKQLGTIFNNEANLIYVSQVGNQKKKNQNYFLKDLNKFYLEKKFKTSDIKVITSTIEETVSSLKKKGILGYWELLNDFERDCVRHALFLDFSNEARVEVENTLKSLYSSKVNGSQGWFVRQIVEKVQNNLKEWCKTTNNKLDFRAVKIKTDDAGQFRTSLGENYPEMVKNKPQPVLSHAVDAMCVFAAACAQDDFVAFTQADARFSDCANISEIHDLFPTESELIRVKARDLSDKDDFGSRPIFKEGILAEHFLPLIYCHKKVYIGYTLPNKDEKSVSNTSRKKYPTSLQVTGNAVDLLNILNPYIEETLALEKPVATYHIAKSKAFELFTKVAQKQANADEILAATVISSISYVTSSKDVKSVLTTDANQTKVCSVADLKLDKRLKENNYVVKLDVGSKATSFKCSGKIELPLAHDWERVLNNEGIVKAATSKELEELDNAIDKLWTQGAKRAHKAVRRVHSLPIIPTTGALFRIKRTSIHGDDVYQLSDSNLTAVGFQKDNNGNVNWKSPVLFKDLNSHAVTPRGLDDLNLSDDFIQMNKWRDIDLEDDEISLQMCPGSADRSLIRLTITFEKFNEILKAHKLDTYSSYLSVPSEVKLPKLKSDKDSKLVDKVDPFSCVFKQEFRQLIGVPREGSALIIESLGNKITFCYKAERCNKTMKDAYNKGHI